MKVVFQNYEISVRDEPTYSRNSTDNARSYNNEYCRSEKYQHISAHGITVGDIHSQHSSAIILGVGGATGVNEDSVAYCSDTLFIAAGDAVFSLTLPSLELKWCKKVDFATCFGVYWVQDKSCLITWGELNVSCLSEHGKEIWSTSGPDIFTEAFEVKGDFIKVTDFNNDMFLINIENGEMSNANT